MHNSMAGDKGCGSSVSDGTIARGRALTIAETSAIRVTSNSCVSWDRPSSIIIPSNTRRMVPICLSHTPPRCEACGGLKCHSQLCSLVNRSNLASSNRFRALSSSDFPPIKLVPRSDLSSDTGPRRAKKRLWAQIKELESIDPRTSIWTALLLRQVC